MLPIRIGVVIVGVLGSFFPPPALAADVDAVRLWRAPDHTGWCWTSLPLRRLLVNPEEP